LLELGLGGGGVPSLLVLTGLLTLALAAGRLNVDRRLAVTAIPALTGNVHDNGRASQGEQLSGKISRAFRARNGSVPLVAVPTMGHGHHWRQEDQRAERFKELREFLLDGVNGPEGDTLKRKLQQVRFLGRGRVHGQAAFTERLANSTEAGLRRGENETNRFLSGEELKSDDLVLNDGVGQVQDRFG
jgi:hypothetical protein